VDNVFGSRNIHIDESVELGGNVGMGSLAESGYCEIEAAPLEISDLLNALYGSLNGRDSPLRAVPILAPGPFIHLSFTLHAD
jgi:hypothetical protein